MANAFYKKPFDEGTLLKLEIFRGYIREWLPVFLTQADRWEIHVFDFFAGRGSDEEGNPGSPLILLQELDAFMRDRPGLVSKTASINVHFNDENPNHIAQLQQKVGEIGFPKACRTQFSQLDFVDAFAEEIVTLRRPNTASLVLLDQCGMKYVNREVFRQLVDCRTTDVLFFISSGTLKRFCDEASIQQYLPVDPAEICKVSSKEIHRFTCQVYRKMVPPGREYYLAPFSLQKADKRNIYGVVFGSGSILGLEKFLRVCWDKDQVTGEANYNIDDDFAREDPGLWPELNVIHKQDRFEKDLTEFIKVGRRNNLEIYRFCLESGFLPRHGKELLQKLQDDGRIQTVDLKVRRTARKGAFYLSWDQYKTGQPRISIEYRG